MKPYDWFTIDGLKMAYFLQLRCLIDIPVISVSDMAKFSSQNTRIYLLSILAKNMNGKESHLDD